MKASTRFGRITRAALAVAFVLTIGAGAGLATPLTIVGGTQFVTPPGNGNSYFGPDATDQMPTQYGYLGADLRLDAGNWTVTYQYLFKEAGYQNHFRDSANVVRFNTNTTTFGTSFSENVSLGSAGWLNFSFVANAGGAPVIVVNGSNPGSSQTSPGFFLAIDGNTSSSPYLRTGQIAYIALDDQGFTGDDDNHDDLIVKVTVAPNSVQVPDPLSSLAALGLGLLSLGSLKRRLGK